MGLQTLIHTIQEESDNKLQSLIAEQAQVLAKRTKELETEKTALEERLLRDARNKVQEKIQRAERQARLHLHTTTLKTRQSVLDAVYEEALASLLVMPEDTLVSWYKDLLETLPHDAPEAQLRVSTKMRKVLETACKKASCTIPLATEPLENDEGFRFESTVLELDFTLKTLLTSAREQTETEVANILFRAL